MPQPPIAMFPQQMAQGFDMMFTQGNTMLQAMMTAHAQAFEAFSKTIQATNANIVNSINNVMGGFAGMVPAPLSQIGALPQGGKMMGPMGGLPGLPFPPPFFPPLPGMPMQRGGQAMGGLPGFPGFPGMQKKEMPQAPMAPFSNLQKSNFAPQAIQVQQTPEEKAQQDMLSTGQWTMDQELEGGFTEAPVFDAQIDGGLPEDSLFY